MSVYKLGEDSPRIAASAYVAPNASVLGKVILAEHVTVWFGATLRGDNETIDIGAGSNVQDSAVMHTDPGFPLTVGAHVSIGHQAMMHGCSVGEGHSSPSAKSLPTAPSLSAPLPRPCVNSPRRSGRICSRSRRITPRAALFTGITYSRCRFGGASIPLPHESLTGRESE